MNAKLIKQISLGVILFSCSNTKTEETYLQKFKNSLHEAKKWTTQKWNDLTGKKEEVKGAKFECPRKDKDAVATTAPTTSPEALATTAPAVK